jgi:ACR3 family arsenite efflux pump ArsB
VLQNLPAELLVAFLHFGNCLFKKLLAWLLLPANAHDFSAGWQVFLPERKYMQVCLVLTMIAKLIGVMLVWNDVSGNHHQQHN